MRTVWEDEGLLHSGLDREKYSQSGRQPQKKLYVVRDILLIK